MMTATKALEVLVTAGLATSASLKTVKSGELRWKEPEVKSDLLSVDSETYGSVSELYVRAKDEDTARKAADALRALGGQPNFGWCSDNPKVFSLKVSGFKGWHYWE